MRTQAEAGKLVVVRRFPHVTGAHTVYSPRYYQVCSHFS